MRFCILFLVSLFLTGLALPAEAHPHIFVRYDVAISPAEPGYIKLHFTFTFQGLPNPILTPGVLAKDQPQLKKDMLANLAEHPFFVYLDMDGQTIGRQTVRPVPQDGEDAKDQLYAFDLTLPDTVGNFGFALYDPEYFDSVWMSGAHSLTVKLEKFACTIEEQQVSKTVWGILRKQYVQCGNKTGPKAPAHRLKPPDELPVNPQDLPNGHDLLP